MIVNAGGLTVNGTFVSSSDRNVKENFRPLDGRAVLAKVAALPLSEWNYKRDAADLRHLGPMAQDFHAAFGLNGDDDTHISVVDEGGVALAAIQGLNAKVEAEVTTLRGALRQKETEVAELKQRNTATEARLAALERLVGALAGTTNGGTR